MCSHATVLYSNIAYKKANTQNYVYIKYENEANPMSRLN